jgi:hypothetical protein
LAFAVLILLITFRQPPPLPPAFILITERLQRQLTLSFSAAFRLPDDIEITPFTPIFFA